MTIKKLERVLVENKENGIQISRLANQEEIINKLNEVIEVLNKLDIKEGKRMSDGFVKSMTKGW